MYNVYPESAVCALQWSFWENANADKDKVSLLLTTGCSTASLEVTHITEGHYAPFTPAKKPTNTCFVWNVMTIILIYFRAN